MATVEKVRGMGFAKNLMNHCIEYVKSKDGNIPCPPVQKEGKCC